MTTIIKKTNMWTSKTEIIDGFISYDDAKATYLQMVDEMDLDNAETENAGIEDLEAGGIGYDYRLELIYGTNSTIYRVNIIRSQRANEREGYEHPKIEKHVGDYSTIEEAQEAYNAQSIGTETDKEIVNIESGEVIETTY